jgi:L-alanine-DL-glutamate epimerase-like enolase superfamily enzyme
MKITAVRSLVVLGPRRAVYGKVYQSALGASAVSEHGLVFVETDDGITGLGEISSVFKRRGKLLCREVEQLLGPALVGEDPFRIASLVQKMDRVLDGSEVAKAGLEMALFDIVGKALQTPVYTLLGGQVRDRVPLSFSIPFGEPAEMARFATELVAQGYRTVKIKVGMEARRDLEAVRQVREAVGSEVNLRVDANMAWRTPKEAIGMIRAMEPYRLQLVEQPLHPRDLDGLAFVRQHVSVPIMADESVWGPRDAMDVIRKGAADIVNVYVSESGGLLNASRTFAMCEAAGIPCMIGSMPEFGLGTAACIHLGVAMTNLGLDSDTCGVLYHAEDLLTEPLRIEAAFAYPPTGPGLGVELNMEVVERWRLKE